MKTLNKMRFTSLLLTLFLAVMMAVPTVSLAAGQGTVDLLSTSSFAVLSGETITNTGATTISGSVGGDVGLSPGSAFPGKELVTMSGGAIHLADAVALTAKNDLIKVYDDAAGRAPSRIKSELGGNTYFPGTYDSADENFKITGTLTLDAQGDPNAVFVFQTNKTLITMSGSNVKLINGARFCRTFWKVGSSATLGTYSHFEGHIFALTSITAKTGASVQGQLLARNGSVTLDNNTITNGTCETTSTTPPVVPANATLHVIKHVINDNSGTAVAAGFKLHVKTADGKDVDASPAPGVESPGTTYTLAPGTYVVNEDASDGYAVSYSGDRDVSGNFTVALGSSDNKTVTITNNDVSPTPTPTPTPAATPTPTPAPTSTPTPTAPVTTTITGGQLPNTSTHMYELLLIGAALTLFGVLGWRSRKRYV